MRKLLSGQNAKGLIRRVLTEGERRDASALLEPYMSDDPPSPFPQATIMEGGVRKVAPFTKAENFMAGRYDIALPFLNWQSGVLELTGVTGLQQKRQ